MAHTRVPISAGGRTFYFRPNVIHDHLPYLYRYLSKTSSDYSSLAFLRHCCDSVCDQALRIICEYLHAIQRHGTSNAFLGALEYLWERPRHRSWHSRRSDGLDDLSEIFIDLGVILNPKFFGCGQAIFGQMKDFFLKHGGELISEDEDWIDYVNALCSASPDKHQMAPVLSLVLDKVSKYPQFDIGLREIHPRLIRMLETLYDEKYKQNHRMRLPHNKIMEDRHGVKFRMIRLPDSQLGSSSQRQHLYLVEPMANHRRSHHSGGGSHPRAYHRLRTISHHSPRLIEPADTLGESDPWDDEGLAGEYGPHSKPALFV